MKIESPAFEDGERIPEAYTCDGNQTLSPPLAIDGVPVEAQSLVLIVIDPDVPKAVREDGLFTHWILFDMPPETVVIPEGGIVGTPGANTRGDAHYTGPCPPLAYEPATHRYFFRLYALDTELNLAEGVSKEEVERNMEDHVLATAELMGTYSRT